MAGSTEHLQLMAERQVFDRKVGSGSKRPAGRAEQGGKPNHGARILMLLGRLRKHEARRSSGEASEDKYDLKQADPIPGPAWQILETQADAFLGTDRRPRMSAGSFSP